MSVALTSNDLEYRAGPEDWRDEAQCAGSNPDLWVPDSEPAGDPNVQAAKRVCARCPVRAECLEDAVQHGDSGIRGGLTTVERTGVPVSHFLQLSIERRRGMRAEAATHDD